MFVSSIGVLSPSELERYEHMANRSVSQNKTTIADGAKRDEAVSPVMNAAEASKTLNAATETVIAAESQGPLSVHNNIDPARLAQLLAD